MRPQPEQHRREGDTIETLDQELWSHKVLVARLQQQLSQQSAQEQHDWQQLGNYALEINTIEMKLLEQSSLSRARDTKMRKLEARGREWMTTALGLEAKISKHILQSWTDESEKKKQKKINENLMAENHRLSQHNSQLEQMNQELQAQQQERESAVQMRLRELEVKNRAQREWMTMAISLDANMMITMEQKEQEIKEHKHRHEVGEQQRQELQGVIDAQFAQLQSAQAQKFIREQQSRKARHPNEAALRITNVLAVVLFLTLMFCAGWNVLSTWADFCRGVRGAACFLVPCCAIIVALAIDYAKDLCRAEHVMIAKSRPYYEIRA